MWPLSLTAPGRNQNVCRLSRFSIDSSARGRQVLVAGLGVKKEPPGREAGPLEAQGGGQAVVIPAAQHVNPHVEHGSARCAIRQLEHLLHRRAVGGDILLGERNPLLHQELRRSSTSASPRRVIEGHIGKRHARCLPVLSASCRGPVRSLQGSPSVPKTRLPQRKACAARRHGSCGARMSPGGVRSLPRAQGRIAVHCGQRVSQTAHNR